MSTSDWIVLVWSLACASLLSAIIEGVRYRRQILRDQVETEARNRAERNQLIDDMILGKYPKLSVVIENQTEKAEHEIWPDKSLSWYNHDKTCSRCYSRKDKSDG